MIKTINTDSKLGIESGLETRKARLREACREFEGVFANYLFKSMEKTVQRAEEPDQATQLFEGMRTDYLAKEVSRRQGLGIEEMLYKQLLPLLEGKK